MKRGLRWRLIVILSVVLICSYILITNPISPGLDISGGTHFTVEVMPENLSKEIKEDTVAETLAVYRNRIDEIGFAGTTIQQAGSSRILIQVPGIDTVEADRIKKILQRQAHLEFRVVVDGPNSLQM